MSELPTGWVWTNFVEIAEASKNALKAGPFGSALKKEFYVPSGYKIYGQEQVIRENPFYGDYYIDYQKYKSLESCAVKPGDILISLVGTIGKVLILPEGIEAGIINPRLVKLSLEKRLVIPEFIKNYLESPEVRYHFSSLSHGGTMDILNLTTLKTLLIPLPPLNEQRRIVAKLDRLFDRSRRAREELERIPKLCDRYKQAVLTAAFRGDLTAYWRKENNLPASSILRLTINEPYKNDFFAPEHWRSYDLVQVCRFVGGSQPPKSMFSYTPKPGYLRLIQIRDYKSDGFITYVPKESVRRFCTVDDVMIGRYGPPIFQILRGIEGAYNVALMKAEPCLEIASREFIYYYLQNPTLFNYVDISSDRTAGQSGVNKSHLEKYPVFVPPLEEQTVVVQKIEKLFEAIDQIEQEYQKASKLCDRLEQATLSKAFRGELVPQDPNDEPAAVLLERILAERQNQPKGKAVKSKQKPGEQP